MYRKSYSLETKSLPARTIRFTISDETIDHDGEVMVASGVDFTNFAKNPQFLGFHKAWDFPIGIPKNWGIDSTSKLVWMEVYFPTVDELATDPANASEHAKTVDSIYQMYKLGMLNAVSVGFNAKESEVQNGIRYITSWELLEVSAVPIPCNPNAVVQAKSIEGIHPEVIDMMEKAGATFSQENRKKHSEIVGQMKSLHDDFIEAQKCYKSGMEKCMKSLEDFMTPAVANDESEPEVETGDDAKAIDFDLLKKHLRA